MELLGNSFGPEAPEKISEKLKISELRKFWKLWFIAFSYILKLHYQPNYTIQLEHKCNWCFILSSSLALGQCLCATGQWDAPHGNKGICACRPYLQFVIVHPFAHARKAMFASRAWSSCLWVCYIILSEVPSMCLFYMARMIIANNILKYK